MEVGTCRKRQPSHLTTKMALSHAEVQEIIKSPGKAKQIRKAKLHQNRLKFHTLISVTPSISQPATEFLAWVAGLIAYDKFQIYKQLFRYPVKTNEITGIVYDKLSRIFEGRNPVFNYQFMNSQERDDWDWYREEHLNEPAVWQTTAWEYFKTEVNCVMIVDLPDTPPDTSDNKPQPYFYFLTIDNVISYSVKDDDTGVMDWIIFKQPNNRIAVFDNQSFRVYSMDRNDRVLSTPEIDRPHDLGYCPARFFVDVALDINEPDVKWSPVSKELESLDVFLNDHIGTVFLKQYAKYPIYVGYRQKCDFINADGDYCESGHMRQSTGAYLFTTTGSLVACPHCGNKRLMGAGSMVELDIPEDDRKEITNPIRLIGADVPTLEFNSNELRRDREQIITSIVGTDNDILSEKALNEDQVEASFENNTTILNRVKRIFENAQKWVDETCCRLRYGNSFISAAINYGTDFYLMSATSIREQYAAAKLAGASESELDALSRQLIETMYRNDPLEKQRMLLLAELEPFRHISRDEAMQLYDKGIISRDDLRFKLDFSTLVRRFERENTNIMEFATDIDFAKKINIITETLKKYINEGDTQSQQTPS